MRFVVLIESLASSERTWESAASWPDAVKRHREIEAKGGNVSWPAIVSEMPAAPRKRK